MGKLKHTEELDVLVNDDGGLVVIDAVATILASKAIFFRGEEDPSIILLIIELQYSCILHYL